MILIAAHIILASALFKLVNWIGEHATDFGYASTTLFEEPNESLALNFYQSTCSSGLYVDAFSGGRRRRPR